MGICLSKIRIGKSPDPRINSTSQMANFTVGGLLFVMLIAFAQKQYSEHVES
jgi:hypothetical protein